MQWHFILAAMTAFTFVMLIIAAGINLINYSIIISTQDKVLAELLELEYKQKSIDVSNEASSIIYNMFQGRGHRVDFTSRIFVVRYDNEECDVYIPESYHSEIDEDTIILYAENIALNGRTKGFYKEYRYAAGRDCGIVILLDAAIELQRIFSLFMRSALTVAVSLLFVFFLILFFSRRAIQPFLDNIERQKRFITDASHEMKTPLASIATSTDIIAMESGENEWISNIQKQTMRMKKLVDSLVTLSRLDEGMPFPEKAVFSFSEAAWETSEPFSAIAKAKGKQYTEHIEDHLEYTGARSSIQQMISILLDNAVRYSGEGGEIWLEIYRRHSNIYIEVLNTCSLPEGTDINRLFDRFYRPDESRSVNSGGAGIGLSVAQAIAEAHGGKITVKCTGREKILFRVIL